ncbi:HD-GYP domain-containing protein [Konateibacter massiliensis]|uniref:HD-GYP domain-containing protein n=1 Tax=Konateibacter massiliensis TaxID=2002841 RepID=UPI000C14C2C9|nr:HD-GYP domain-containing protein [Konateibacter massiliensis]
MMKIIKVRDLKPNMIVAKDVYTPFDELIVSANTVLTARGIRLLESYHIREIYIKTAAKATEEVPEEIEEGSAPTASEKMKQSESFKEFYKAFNDSLKVTEKMMDDIAFRAEEINSALVDSMIDRVAKVSNNGIFIFDMLHCMRELDDLTYAHSMSVALICKVFGEWLKMPQSDVDALKMAGFFHDIGKVKIPKEIICKKGKLTPDEYEIVKKHAEFGYEILKGKNLDQRAIMAALMHHEKCDGSGYPNKLKGDQIEEFAKIVSIADAYEAMTASRCYREAICPFTVIGEFENNALQHYEPKYILPLMEMIAQSYIGNNVLLNNGVVGSVIMLNKNSLSRPFVKTENDFIDLSKDKSLSIVKVI